MAGIAVAVLTAVCRYLDGLEAGLLERQPVPLQKSDELVRLGVDLVEVSGGVARWCVAPVAQHLCGCFEIVVSTARSLQRRSR